MKPKKITQKDLADYLGVTPATLSGYKNTTIGKRKVNLMLKGLQKLQEEKESRLKLS